MASLIQNIARLAINTFRRDKQLSQTNFKKNYDQLCDLLARLTPSDLRIDPALLVDRGRFNPSRDGAPVTYMQIYEDFDLTICVFILKRGVRLPLHDHPGMCGLLKVVHGVVSIQSYTFISDSNTSETGAPTFPNTPDLPSPTQPLGLGFSHTRVMAATKHPTLTATASAAPCQLSPNANNVHEIHSIDGPAAFLDILSPPYGADERMGLERDCHYYKEVNVSPTSPQEVRSNGHSVFLYRVETPSDFWCDQADYCGPVIECDRDKENGVERERERERVSERERERERERVSVFLLLLLL
ncbi:2-aminoethanethiol dioxygenase-like [Portunus trituberculatus]|uniref:2-aminoethanethiol dioxygenase-like n=1 Tax=Portunus trituberculatus TaxID=210409 RepID=UPI001E1D08DF|nr:2-aminoethanethiol dioxygenase-like [Portunus trituberculatus]